MGLSRVGLLGGSFDPVHLTHVQLASAARQALQLDHVEMIPAAQPWQRDALAASGKHRLAMLKLATQSHPWIHINPIELNRDGPTYTIDTIRQLRPDTDYYWIMGSDQLENFCSWYQWEEIARSVWIAVALRPGTMVKAPPALQQLLNHFERPLHELPFDPSTVSATYIRERLARGESTHGLLNVAVAQYIQQNELYRPPPEPGLAV